MVAAAETLAVEWMNTSLKLPERRACLNHDPERKRGSCLIDANDSSCLVLNKVRRERFAPGDVVDGCIRRDA
ncbi:hypothetical protein D3C80_1857610 [compost metagenome]